MTLHGGGGGGGGGEQPWAIWTSEWTTIGTSKSIVVIIFVPNAVSDSGASNVVFICVNCDIIGSGNGLSPVQRQANTLIIADLLSVKPMGTRLNGIWVKISNFFSKNMHLNMSSAKCQPFYSSLKVLTQCGLMMPNKNWSTLAQVMACCLMAASHYPEPMLTCDVRCSLAYTWERFARSALELNP